MATISLPGLLSGIDTTTLITGLMNLAKAPLTAAQSEKTTVQSKKDAVSALETRLGQLRDLAQTLWDPTANRAVTASTSNGQVASAWTSAGGRSNSFKASHIRAGEITSNHATIAPTSAGRCA